VYVLYQCKVLDFSLKDCDEFQGSSKQLSFCQNHIQSFVTQRHSRTEGDFIKKSAAKKNLILDHFK
jgi:hypothetical protein